MTIFTTLKVQNGIPLFFEKHQKRLQEHAQALDIPFPSTIRQEVNDYLGQKKLTECALRIELNNEHGITITHRTLPTNCEEITTISVADTRDANKIYKTANRQINEQATQKARSENADDALFVYAGNLIESPIANLFSEDSEGNLITTPIEGKGLAGITRQIIMENQEVLEKNIPEYTNGPLVLVNSLRIQVVTHLNEKRLANPDKLFIKVKTCIEKAEKSYLTKE